MSSEEIAKNNYMSSAANTERVQDYLSLYEFGFTDFLVNQHLLKKYNNIDVVANMLMSGQVSQEEIN